MSMQILDIQISGDKNQPLHATQAGNNDRSDVEARDNCREDAGSDSSDSSSVGKASEDSYDEARAMQEMGLPAQFFNSSKQSKNSQRSAQEEPSTLAGVKRKRDAKVSWKVAFAHLPD